MEKLNEQVAAPLMSFEEYARHEHEQPYVYELEKGENRLVYFGAYHSHDPNDRMFDQIEETFERLDPEAVVVEGMEGLDTHQAFIEEKLRALTPEQAIVKGGESGFVLKLAAGKGIEMSCPEPEFGSEIENLLEQGFSRERVFAYYLYRAVAQYWRLKQELAFGEYIEPYIADFKRVSGWEDFDYSEKNLENIGREVWGEAGGFDNKEVADRRIDPVPWPGTEGQQTEINEIARASCRFRDEHIMKSIKELLARKNRVLVVYGASHAYMQEPALRSMLQSK